MLSINKILLIIAATFLTFTSLFAQQNRPRRQCLSGINEPVTQFRTTPYISQAKLKQTSRTTITKLPTVVHIIHLSGELNGKGDNLSYEQIMSQINATNKDLLYKNSNKRSTLTEFKGDVANLYVELKMAVYDPEGNELYEPGVNRIVGIPGNTGVYDKTKIRNLIRENIWDPEKYVNIWVARLSNHYLGYAYFPDYPDLQGLDGLTSDEIASETIDGIVLHTDYFGSNEFKTFSNLSAPYDLGRTLTHEIGHYLGILHIWGLGNPGSCDQDDYCTDTPKINNHHGSSASSTICDGDTSSITNNLCDIEEYNSAQYQNFMDYTDDACMTMFSIDQKSRVDIILESAPQRHTLNMNAPSGDITLNGEDDNYSHVLSWSSENIKDAKGYIIERQIENYGYEIISPVLDLNTTSYSAYYDPSDFDKEILYRVFLVNHEGYSLSSNIIRLEDGVLDNTKPVIERFSVFPNPSEGIFNLYSSEYIHQTGVLEVWDTHGKKILTRELSKYEEKVKVDLSNYPNGTYIMKISSDKGVYSQICIKK